MKYTMKHTPAMVSELRGVLAHTCHNLGAVRGVLVHAQLEALAELLVKLLVIVLLSCTPNEQLEALRDNAQRFGLLQNLAGYVQRQALGDNLTLHEVVPLRQQHAAVVHDGDTSHVQFDVVTILPGTQPEE